MKNPENDAKKNINSAAWIIRSCVVKSPVHQSDNICVLDVADIPFSCASQSLAANQRALHYITLSHGSLESFISTPFPYKP